MGDRDITLNDEQLAELIAHGSTVTLTTTDDGGLLTHTHIPQDRFKLTEPEPSENVIEFGFLGRKWGRP